MKEQELTSTIERIKELEAQQEEINAELESLKDTMKAYMVSQNAEKMLIGGYKVNYTKYVTHRFDTKTFKVDHEALYAQYTKETQARRFTIS